MPSNLKALLVVLAFSGITLALARPVALRFMEEQDFKRRRNAWLILSAAAFGCSNYWLFVLIAAPVLYWGGKKDTNPLAYFLFLMNVIPSLPIQIPTAALGIGELFPVDIFVLLSFCVLLPAARRLRTAERESGRKLRFMDWLLLGYIALRIILFVPPDLPNHVILQTSFTGDLRTALFLFTTVYLVYYVASRSCPNRRSIGDAMAALCLACTIMALIACLEGMKNWPLYNQLYVAWDPGGFGGGYLLRGGSLRAAASAGHPLALGYLLAVALGFWLYLQTQLQRRLHRLIVAAVLCGGLLITFSRGPWLGALVIYLVYAALSRRGSRFLKAAIAPLMLCGLLSLTPLGDRIANMLPFMGGQVDVGSLTYRERLADRSWELILEHPLFGDQLAYSHMEDLRQGQGIIDIVNTYVDVTLFYGFVGLALFASFILLGLGNAYRARAAWLSIDPDSALMAASIIACIAGTLVMLLDCSFILGYVPMFYTLAGLGTACMTAAQPEKSLSHAPLPRVELR
jgi:O-antigen ligase